MSLLFCLLPPVLGGEASPSPKTAPIKYSTLSFVRQPPGNTIYKFVKLRPNSLHRQRFREALSVFFLQKKTLLVANFQRGDFYGNLIIEEFFDKNRKVPQFFQED
jgi:hypothetical protein